MNITIPNPTSFDWYVDFLYAFFDHRRLDTRKAPLPATLPVTSNRSFWWTEGEEVPVRATAETNRVFAHKTTEERRVHPVTEVENAVADSIPTAESARSGVRGRFLACPSGSIG